MNYGELIQGVISDTGRDDQIRAIGMHLNNCIRKISRTGEYSFAISELVYNGPFTESINSLALPNYYKSVFYIKDNSENAALPKLTPAKLASPDYRDTALCGWYQSGNNIIIRSLSVPEKLYAGWYLYPIALVEEIDENWVTQQLPDLLIDYASAMLLTVLGDTAAGDRLKAYTNEQLTQSIANLLRT